MGEFVTSTVYGKVARLLHTAVVSVLLLSSLYSVFVPSSEGVACSLEPFADDPVVVRYLQGLISLLNWWGVGFFAQCTACNMGNMLWVTAMLVGACIINIRMRNALTTLDSGRIPAVCWDGLVQFVIVVCLAEGIVLLLMVYDQSKQASSRNGTQGEQQQLVV